MEEGQMASVIPDISPPELLARFRGRIIAANPAYPETIHLEVRDEAGDLWKFATHDAAYSPSDPCLFPGKTVVSVALEGPLGNLTVGFSDETDFRVTVEPQDAEDDPVNWRLYTPDGFILAWGPGVHWALKRADEPI
jgi:hypothetical protein